MLPAVRPCRAGSQHLGPRSGGGVLTETSCHQRLDGLPDELRQQEIDGEAPPKAAPGLEPRSLRGSNARPVFSATSGRDLRSAGRRSRGQARGQALSWSPGMSHEAIQSDIRLEYYGRGAVRVRHRGDVADIVRRTRSRSATPTTGMSAGSGEDVLDLVEGRLLHGGVGRARASG